jgi:hypothetical protein
MQNDLFIKVDQTSGFNSGQSSYINTSLAGVNFSVEQHNIGTLQPGVNYNPRSDGGFDLIGDVFSSGTEFVIHPISLIQSLSATNYTNGFDISQVLPELETRLGWRQPTKSGSLVLNTFNKTSKSGRFFQSFHALVTISNIKDVQEEANISDADLNQYLQNLQDDAIMRALSEVFKSSELIEQKLLYTRFGTNDLIINNASMFCGFLINIANDFGITTQINQCTLYFDADVNFNIYVYQDGVKTPIRTIPVSCNAYERNTIIIDNLYLNYKIGRRFYIGYFQDDLGNAHAIQEMVDTWAKTFCFEAIPVAAPIDVFFGFNHNYRQYTALPRGLNFEMISFRDHTQQIMRKSNLFDEVIGLTVAFMVLEQLNMTTRSNINERQLKMATGALTQELNQAYATDAFPLMPGFKARIMSEYKMLRESFFPKTKSDSTNREGLKADSYNDKWAEANFRQMTNPPMMGK